MRDCNEGLIRRTGSDCVEEEVTEGIGGFGVFVAVPVQALVPLTVFSGVEEEEMVVAAFNAEREDDEDGVREALGRFDMHFEICAVDAICAVMRVILLRPFRVEESRQLRLKGCGLIATLHLAVEEGLRGDVEGFAKHHDVATNIRRSIQFEVIDRDLVREELVL